MDNLEIGLTSSPEPLGSGHKFFRLSALCPTSSFLWGGVSSISPTTPSVRKLLPGSALGEGAPQSSSLFWGLADSSLGAELFVAPFLSPPGMQTSGQSNRQRW